MPKQNLPHTAESVRISVQLDATTYEKLVKCADAQRRSLSNMGEWAIARYLQIYDEENG